MRWEVWQLFPCQKGMAQLPFLFFPFIQRRDNYCNSCIWKDPDQSSMPSIPLKHAGSQQKVGDLIPPLQEACASKLPLLYHDKLTASLKSYFQPHKNIGCCSPSFFSTYECSLSHTRKAATPSCSFKYGHQYHCSSFWPSSLQNAVKSSINYLD